MEDNTLKIGTFFAKCFKMDNARYNMYHEENHYSCIPKLLFKFDLSEGQEIYKKIKEVVESFKGNLDWTLEINKENLRRYKILTPKLYASCAYENAEIDFLGEAVYKDTCEKAIQDIPNLAEHLQKFL